MDIRLVLPDRTPFRERTALRTMSKSAARRWGQRREQHVLVNGVPSPDIPAPELAEPKKEVPTLAAFAPRFIDGYARANRQKPSGIAAKELLLRLHLVPPLGHRRLDCITNEDVQQLKLSMKTKAAKTINNALAVLSILLKVAVEWEVIEKLPCTIRLLRVQKPTGGRFHDFDQYERLVEAARAQDWVTALIVLLGGEAGLRCGEMIALEWTDVDLTKRQLCIERSDWNGQVTSPKSGRLRYVPLTVRLAAALREHRHLRGRRVLCHDDGSSLTRQQVQYRVKRAARKANVKDGVHLLRHTFCSHLAMRGAPAKAIQELAGHSELGVTQRYMHLSPAALDAAIQLLDGRGNMLATNTAGHETRGLS